MRSKILVAAVLALSSLVAVPAFAKGQSDQKFPMPAAAFKAKVDAHTQKAREKMEARVAKLPADKAKEVRAKFDESVAKVNQEVAKVTADGTVTKEEAKEVREVRKSARPHGRHARHGKNEKKG